MSTASTAAFEISSPFGTEIMTPSLNEAAFLVAIGVLPLGRAVTRGGRPALRFPGSARREIARFNAIRDDIALRLREATLAADADAGAEQDRRDAEPRA